MNNLSLKSYFSKLMNGLFVNENSVMPGYPTIDVRLATVVAKTSNYTVTMADLAMPTIVNNTGAGGNINLTLPKARLARGKVLRAHALAAQTIRLAPQTGEAVNYNGAAVVTKYCQLAGVIGNSIEVFSDGTQWVVTKGNGVITKEA